MPSRACSSEEPWSRLAATCRLRPWIRGRACTPPWSVACWTAVRCRAGTEERLSFEEVVSAYTQANARAAGVADRRGTLGIGMDADLVAWQADPVLDRGDGEAFLNGRAALTVVGGEVMMQA